MKIDIANGFYRIPLNVDDIPKLGVVFPVREKEEPLVAFPLVLPMGWVNSPPAFCAATETSADIANAFIRSGKEPDTHSLDAMAGRMDQMVTEPKDPNIPDITRDPCLPEGVSTRPLEYVDVFVDDFLALAQGDQARKRVRRILMKAIDDVFRPMDFYDKLERRDPISIKKLKKGDCSWSTIKIMLGWILDTVNMVIKLPEHREKRLAEILSSIPRTQKRISVKKWHKVLGELRSMSLALPGSRHLFSQMQEALTSRIGQRINLRKGVHNALDDFRWLLQDIANRPTRMAEVVPLNPSAIGYHDASGKGAGGVWFKGPALHPRHNPKDKPLPNPIVWRLEWPKHIQDALVTEDNPFGTLTNSDLELAGGLLHLEAIANNFDVRERTILSKTDNLATLYWQRKGSATTTAPPAHLLRLFGIHQRYHRYVPRHDYIPGKSNPLADESSRLFYMNDSQFLTHLNSKFQQPLSFRLVQIPPNVISSVISALHKKTCSAESLLVDPLPAIHTGESGQVSQIHWASTPFSKPSKTKYRSYKSSSTEYVPEHLLPTAIQSGLARLKTTYGQLARRSWQWGKGIPA